MPDFNQLRSKNELESLYLGKVIVVVEDDSDAELYQRLIGPGKGEFLEFQVPHEKGTGCGAVKHSVKVQREKNKRVYGLLDGEVSVSHDGYDKFRECTDPIFEMHGLDGLMFLAEHEAENILINHADIETYIEHDVSLHGLGKRSPVEIETKVEAVVDRQFWAAMCKYVSYEMHKEKQMEGVLGNTFYADASLCRSMKLIKSGVIGQKGDWKTFKSRLKKLRGGTETYLQSLSPASRKKARRRLADGKMALAKIQSVFGLKPTWQGHLVKEVAASAYATDFRIHLFEKTQIKD
ncbi:hypothetical protein [Mesorhizobium amorphae]|uniref:DUF4435 domain-containing protein n=1 Tax=Mesorhizobium amorphae CCNWGS0123 TaxID=1082933 RepID=G6YG79_9HYPH|nr:hypothetical protein [Mesorhizobium amorphae]ANT54811.1 hypothetical protein A6B35_33115 [Mesorhizobium amorphae CCNWGS0123]EHH09260.1 hypothetical protein MEA186_24937 [Mesorhizobium amorphae CCNWGS0123]